MGRDTIRVSCQLNESLYEVFPRGLRIHAQVPPMTTWLGDMALVEEDSELEHSFLEAIYTGNNPDGCLLLQVYTLQSVHYLHNTHPHSAQQKHYELLALLMSCVSHHERASICSLGDLRYYPSCTGNVHSGESLGKERMVCSFHAPPNTDTDIH